MKLSRLELTGFKSFANTVELTFESGITAIVGPNGCGKSNISDAVRWVLGEQRARLLRGSRMEDVIFHGSIKRRPVNIAEIALVFDNVDGALPIPYSEVVLMRRLSRSGQSEYLLNQTPVRLRDLQDLLRGTGMGSDAGVVIEAQMMDRLLSERPEERRSLFEEAAGIGLYRDRRATTERRLEKTGEDLQRLEDVISEVQTQVRSLARQRGKAERYTKFTDERFAIVMTLTRADLAELDQRRESLNARCATLRDALPRKRDTLTERSGRREILMQERAAAEARRATLERQLGETRLALQRLEADLTLAAERLDRATERKRRATEEHSEVLERAERASRELEAAEDELRASQAARQSVQGELDLRTTGEAEIRSRLADQRAVVRELEESLQAGAQSLRALAGERATLERDLEDLHTHESAAVAAARTAERENEKALEESRRVEAIVRAREGEERTAVQELERARDALTGARERELARRTEQRRLDDSIALDAARREALEELQRNREGLQPGARELLAARENFGDGTVLGPLSDFLDASAEEAHRAELLLGEWLHAVLVRDATAVTAVAKWHEETRPGPLVLLPVQPGPASTAADPIATTLRISQPAGAWVAALLSGNALDVAEPAIVRRANGAVYLPGTGPAGPLTRRAELEALTVELEQERARLEALAVETEAAAQAHREAEQHLVSANDAAARTKNALREAQGLADEASRQLLRAEREQSESSATLARIRERIAERQTRLQRVDEELAQGEAERVRLEEQLANERTALSDVEAAQESARERRVHWQVEEAQVSAREDAAREREARARAELQAARTGIEGLEQELRDIDESTRDLTQQRAHWEDTLAERRVAVQEMDAASGNAETAVADVTERLADEELAIEETRAELDRMGEELHRLELELTELDGRRRALTERVEAEWHKPIDALVEAAPPVEGAGDELRQREQELAEQIEALGPVNPLAVDEHAEEVARFEFLASQRDDIIAARKSLQQALREIDETARGMFLETFNAIRENFHSVFDTLFDGGECDVSLTDDDDPLTSDIEIRAAPRGKRTQRIHLLSSGERALVAISLLFSIYLTKPAPFCLLDEVDAPLDDSNVMRFVRLLEEFKADTQFIVITHNPRTMQVADAVYGVTMQEPGVSTIVGVRLGERTRTTV